MEAILTSCEEQTYYFDPPSPVEPSFHVTAKRIANLDLKKEFYFPSPRHPVLVLDSFTQI
jgi:hypothetical protein